MPTLAVNNFNIVLSVLGGWVSLFGLVSYLCKENFYLSEACKCVALQGHLDRPELTVFMISSDIAPGWGDFFSSRSQLHPAA